MPKKFFISFGDQKFQSSLDRIKNQAQSLDFFDEIIIYNDNDLRNMPEFWNAHHSFIQQNKRGYGYWLWKPYLVRYTIENLMKEDDTLVYADSGCTLNKHGRSRLMDYISIVTESDFGILSFRMDHRLEKEWTKMDIFDHFDANYSHFLNTGQMIATTFILRKCYHTQNIIDLWYETSCNYYLLNDSPSRLTNDPSFEENRHDQSIFSVIRKIYGSENIPDETYYEDWNQGYHKPILTTRHKHVPFLS